MTGNLRFGWEKSKVHESRTRELFENHSATLKRYSERLGAV